MVLYREMEMLRIRQKGLGRWLSVLAVVEDLGSVSNVHMVAHTHL